MPGQLLPASAILRRINRIGMPSSFCSTVSLGVFSAEANRCKFSSSGIDPLSALNCYDSETLSGSKRETSPGSQPWGGEREGGIIYSLRTLWQSR